MTASIRVPDVITLLASTKTSRTTLTLAAGLPFRGGSLDPGKRVLSIWAMTSAAGGSGWPFSSAAQLRQRSPQEARSVTACGRRARIGIKARDGFAMSRSAATMTGSLLSAAAFTTPAAWVKKGWAEQAQHGHVWPARYGPEFRSRGA